MSERQKKPKFDECEKKRFLFSFHFYILDDDDDDGKKIDEAKT